MKKWGVVKKTIFCRHVCKWRLELLTANVGKKLGALLERRQTRESVKRNSAKNLLSILNVPKSERGEVCAHVRKKKDFFTPSHRKKEGRNVA